MMTRCLSLSVCLSVCLRVCVCMCVRMWMCLCLCTLWSFNLLSENVFAWIIQLLKTAWQINVFNSSIFTVCLFPHMCVCVPVCLCSCVCVFVSLRVCIGYNKKKLNVQVFGLFDILFSVQVQKAFDSQQWNRLNIAKGEGTSDLLSNQRRTRGGNGIEEDV